MADHITISPAAGTWVVRAGGAILGESKHALELREGTYDPVIYFPRSDVAMALLDRTDKISHSPHKGEANYYSIQTKSQTLANAAWTYENPILSVERIKDHLAFYPGQATVERI